MTICFEGRTLFEALNELVKDRRSGRLHVEHWDRKEGVIGLAEGRIVHCQCRKRRGTEALNILRNWISVSFRLFENVETLSIDIEEDTRTILADMERQDEEIKRIRELIPNSQVIFVLSPDSPEGRMSLDKGLWRVISMINGRNSVKDISLGLKANEYSVCRILYHLHGKGVIRVAAAETPLAPTLRDSFLEGMQEALTLHLGPIAPVIIEDTLIEMRKSAEFITRDDLPLLIDRIGENIEEQEERIQFQGRMLNLIQTISRSDA